MTKQAGVWFGWESRTKAVSENGKHNFRFLNADGRWPLFSWDGLELNDDGSLQLQTVPLLEGAELFDDEDNQALDGPAGIAVSRDGAIYFSDPVGHRVLRVDPCDSAIEPVRCIGGKGNRPAQFNTPRGLLIPANRDSLFVADSGNPRIQVFDLNSCQLVDIWDDGFNTPWALAGDR